MISEQCGVFTAKLHQALSVFPVSCRVFSSFIACAEMSKHKRALEASAKKMLMRLLNKFVYGAFSGDYQIDASWSSAACTAQTHNAGVLPTLQCGHGV